MIESKNSSGTFATNGILGIINLKSERRISAVAVPVIPALEMTTFFAVNVSDFVVPEIVRSPLIVNIRGLEESVLGNPVIVFGSNVIYWLALSVECKMKCEMAPSRRGSSVLSVCALMRIRVMVDFSGCTVSNNMFPVISDVVPTTVKGDPRSTSSMVKDALVGAVIVY